MAKIFSIERLKTDGYRAPTSFFTDYMFSRRREGFRDFLSSLFSCHLHRDPSAAFFRSLFASRSSRSHFGTIVLRRLYHSCCFRDPLSQCRFPIPTYLCPATLLSHYAMPSRALCPFALVYATCRFVPLTGFAYV